MKGFQRLEGIERKGLRSINRSRKENMEVRMLKKHNAKRNWYRQSKDGNEVKDRSSKKSEKRPEIRKR